MKLLSILILLFFEIANAEVPIKVGTFSLATEAGWGSAFELKNGGKAIVTPSYDHEETDGKNKKAAKLKTIQGAWKTTSNGIEISYSSFKDQFKFEQKCKDWKESGSSRHAYMIDRFYINKVSIFFNASLASSDSRIS